MDINELIAKAQQEESTEETSETVTEDSIGLDSEDDSVDLPESKVKKGRGAQARIRELANKKKEVEGRVSELEKALEKNKALSEKFTSVYGTLENPLEQFQQDADFLLTLKSNLDTDADIAALVDKVAKAYHLKGAAPRKMENESKPASDPRVDQFLQESLKDKTESVLESYKVRPEVRGIIANYVMQQKVSPNREAIVNVVKEFVESNGWTKEFLKGTPAPVKESTRPVITGRHGASAPAPEKVNSLKELQRENREKLHAALKARS